MDTYASILLWAIPIFMIMMAVEILYGHYKKHQTYTFMDTISSLSSGMTNILKDSLGLVLVIISYPYIMEKISIMEIEASYLLYVVAFVCIDFASYWNHRLNHSVNIFWNRHVIHHSSEEFNMACALRQSISAWIGFGSSFSHTCSNFRNPSKSNCNFSSFAFIRTILVPHQAHREIGLVGIYHCYSLATQSSSCNKSYLH